MRGLHFLFVTTNALAVFLLYVVVSSSNPKSASLNIMSFFYASLIVAICMTSVLLRIWFHPWIRRSVLDKVPIWSSVRQSAILACAMVALLMLSALKSLGIIDAILIIVAAILFEMFFRVRPPIKVQK